ncbi:uncharacterized protein RSE6_02849 [Rhynchosporium secalis]|uniref:BTB domain-containing protein n=1 Tax=Rhynchosporium secalis TaxID=38038 RepID=A0A1E1M2U2_RHYSE|nr:uncharacterized protein RSE6_02849 [Rhynchosporium secalis]
MTIPQSLKRVAGLEKVTIIVGSNKVSFRVHKNIICQALVFFDAAFKSDFRESSDGIIHMPEDEPLVFSKLLALLYESQLPNGKSTSCERLLYDIYIMAEKLCMDEMANRTMDRIRTNQQISRDRLLYPHRHLSHVRHICENTAEHSPLQRLIIMIMSDDFKSHKHKLKVGDSVLSGGLLEQIWEVSKDHKDFFEQFFTSFTRILLDDMLQYQISEEFDLGAEFC